MCKAGLPFRNLLWEQGRPEMSPISAMEGHVLGDPLPHPGEDGPLLVALPKKVGAGSPPAEWPRQKARGLEET